MACFKLRHLCFTAVVFSTAFSCCRGQGGGGGGAGSGAVIPGTQDAIQIVAQAALCFDNRQVINGCLQSMGINVGGTGAGAPAPAASNGGSTAGICSGPCFGQMTMILSCVNNILSNIQGYSPGLMQGVQAIFQMSCGNVTGQGGAGAGGGGSTAVGGSGGGGSTNVSPNGSSHVAVSSPSQPTSGADGPTSSLRGICSTMLIVWTGTWLLLF